MISKHIPNANINSKINLGKCNNVFSFRTNFTDLKVSLLKSLKIFETCLKSLDL